MSTSAAPGGRSGAAIELTGVTKRYGDDVALDNLSLAIPPGTTFGLIGPNGAGKSTLIRMLVGLLAPTSGRLRVLGTDVAADPAVVRRRLGYVPERHDIYSWMTVAQAIEFVRAFYPTWDHAYCDELMDLFQIDRRKKVRQLSKGMVVKLALLLAVSHRPAVLLLDEPTAGLDPIVHEDFLEGVLRSICGDRTTVLYSSHDLGDVRRLADRVGILRQGRLLIEQDTEALLASTRRVRAVLTDGHLPRWAPEGTIWQKIERREWLLTIAGFDEQILGRIRAENPVDGVEVSELGLGELFRDYIKGEGAAR